MYEDILYVPSHFKKTNEIVDAYYKSQKEEEKKKIIQLQLAESYAELYFQNK